jgi:VanZ family protein
MSRLGGALIMASSSLVFNDYAMPEAASLPAPWREQLRAWLPMLALTLLLVFESTSYFGANRTSAPLRRVVEAFFGFDACVHWNLIHHLIRKVGHFIGYGAFSLVCFRSFWMTLCGATTRMGKQLQAYGLALLVTLLAAGMDELHQSVVPNRSGSFSDVLLDVCGGVALCFALFLAMQAADWIKRVRALPVQESMLTANAR